MVHRRRIVVEICNKPGGERVLEVGEFAGEDIPDRLLED
jgi:hypothetical protein